MSPLRIDVRRHVPWPSIPALIHDRGRLGDRPAVADDAGEQTFASLEAAMTEVGRAVADRGIKPGDRVALWAPNSIRWLEVALGILNNGAIVVPLSTRLKGAEVVHALRASGASLLFTVDHFLGTSFPDLLLGAGDDIDGIPKVSIQSAPAAGLIPWADFLAGAARSAPEITTMRSEALTQTDPAFVVFTSGTTGTPKGAVLHHGAVLWSAVQMDDGFDLQAQDRMFVVLPLFHVFGLAMLFSSLVSGGRLTTTAAAFDADAMIEVVDRDRISVLPGPPTLFDALLARPRRSSVSLTTLRLAFVASTGIPGALVRRLVDAALFDSIVSGYGCTEGLIVSLRRLDEDPETTAEWSGQVLREAEVRVVGSDGNDAAPGTPGELWVRTPSTTSGYIGDDGATAAAIDPDGWFRTGDVGIVDGRGYVRITDRLKDMYIVGGFNAYPAEIEAALQQHAGIAHVAVIGVPDARLGEVGVAYVVRTPGPAVTESDLIAWSRDRLSNYKVPRQVRFLDALPMTATMKVAKSELRSRYEAGA